MRSVYLNNRRYGGRLDKISGRTVATRRADYTMKSPSPLSPLKTPLQYNDRTHHIIIKRLINGTRRGISGGGGGAIPKMSVCGVLGVPDSGVDTIISRPWSCMLEAGEVDVLAVVTV